MARNDDGEFELILGNRQLVSVFLIVVILLGVFFSMGYIVGRNASPLTASAADPGSRSGPPPILVESPNRTTPPSGNTPPQTATDGRKPSPVDETPEEPPAAKREEPKRETPKHEEAKREEPKPPKPEPRAAAPSNEEPRTGQTYLQVVATSRPDAEIVAESLSKKGFSTTIAAGPSPALFRVLVGPVSSGALADTRAKLESAGFKPYVRKY